MTRNFRKPNHTKASAFPRGKVCAYCRRKLPPAEFEAVRHVYRRLAFPNKPLQGPSSRPVKQTYTRCRVCRRLPMRVESYTARQRGLRTPIRLAMMGLPDTHRWALGF